MRQDTPEWGLTFTPTWLLGQDAVVAPPELAVEPRAPAHAKFRLMVPCAGHGPAHLSAYVGCIDAGSQTALSSTGRQHAFAPARALLSNKVGKPEPERWQWHRSAQAGKHKPAWHTIIYSRV